MRIISGKYGRRRFDVPTNITARPTTDMARENLFNVLGNLIDFEDKTVLDLFAGTGAMSFEFLSRGCASVTAVEKARTQAEFIKRVQQQLADRRPALRLAAIRRDSRVGARLAAGARRHIVHHGASAGVRLQRFAPFLATAGLRQGEFLIV